MAKRARGQVRVAMVSTGPSSLAKVLDNLKLYGNENSQTGKRLHWEHICEKYNVPIRHVRKGQAARTKREVVELSIEQVIEWLS